MAFQESFDQTLNLAIRRRSTIDVAQSRTAIHEEETREESKPAGTLQNKLAEFIGRLGIVPELLPVKIMFFLLNFASAAFICYVNIYYMGLGLSVSQIGILAGIRPFVTLISAPLWSSLADKFQIHRWVCLGAIGIVIALRILLIFVKQFGLLVAITIGDEMFSATIAPLVDSNAIAVLGPQRADLYGRQRLFAGLGYGLSATLLGAVSGNAPMPFRNNILIYVSFGTAVALIVLFCGLRAPHASDPPSLVSSMKQILTQRDALIFFFVIFNVGLANAVISTFSVMWVTQLGGPSLLLGLMYGANCLTEVTVFWFSPQLLRKLKASKMLMIAIGAIIVRIGYYAVLPHPWAVLPAELLHGATWALMWCAAIDYAGTLVDPSVRTTMQGLLSGVYTGLGGCVGSFAGGYIQAAVGARVFFGIASGWMVLVGVFFVVAHFCQSHERLLGKLGASVDECAATVVARRPSLFETESKSRRGSMEARRSSVVVLEEEPVLPFDHSRDPAVELDESDNSRVALNP